MSEGTIVQVESKHFATGHGPRRIQPFLDGKSFMVGCKDGSLELVRVEDKTDPKTAMHCRLDIRSDPNQGKLSERVRAFTHLRIGSNGNKTDTLLLGTEDGLLLTVEVGENLKWQQIFPDTHDGRHISRLSVEQLKNAIANAEFALITTPTKSDLSIVKLRFQSSLEGIIFYAVLQNNEPCIPTFIGWLDGSHLAICLKGKGSLIVPFNPNTEDPTLLFSSKNNPHGTGYVNSKTVSFNSTLINLAFVSSFEISDLPSKKPKLSDCDQFRSRQGKFWCFYSRKPVNGCWDTAN